MINDFELLLNLILDTIAVTLVIVRLPKLISYVIECQHTVACFHLFIILLQPVKLDRAGDLVTNVVQVVFDFLCLTDVLLD